MKKPGNLATIVAALITAYSPLNNASQPFPAGESGLHEIRQETCRQAGEKQEGKDKGAYETAAFAGFPLFEGATPRDYEMLRELREKLLLEKGTDLSYTNQLFSSGKLHIDSRIPRLLKRNFLSKADKGEIPWEEVYRRSRIDILEEKAEAFFKKHRHDLTAAAGKYGVDAGVIAAIIGVETGFGSSKFRGAYSWPATFLTIYARSESEYWKEFALDQLAALIKYAEIKGISADKLYDEPSSYTGAYGIGQFEPASLLESFRGEKGNLKDADPWSMTDNIYAVAHYLRHNSRKLRDGNGKIHSGNWKPGTGWNVEKREGNYWSVRAYNNSHTYARIIFHLASKTTGRRGG